VLSSNALWSSDVAVCLTPQIPLEYYAVVTSAKQMTTPLTAPEAIEDIERLRGAIPVVHPTTEMIGRTLALLGTLGYTGRHVFDVALAATMLENGIQTIYTYDERFSKNARHRRTHAVDRSETRPTRPAHYSLRAREPWSAARLCVRIPRAKPCQSGVPPWMAKGDTRERPSSSLPTPQKLQILDPARDPSPIPCSTTPTTWRQRRTVDPRAHRVLRR